MNRARDPKAVKQETRRVIVTVQTAVMPGRRFNSTVDISSMLAIELYDPHTQTSHRSVVDADDISGQRWKQHVRANKCVQHLVSHLRMQYDYDLKVGKSGIQGPVIGLGPQCECYNVQVTTRTRDVKYCRRSSLLPWACGSGKYSKRRERASRIWKAL